MLPEGLPERTLGWSVLEWCSKWLVNPDSYGGIKGDQWVFQPDQAVFVLWFYAVDEDGEWIYRRAYRERAKGTGKSPMVAAIACAEFLGPTKFSHFAEDGSAIGKRNHDPMVWLAATSQDGSDHTYKYVMNMLEGKAEQAFNLDIGLTRIYVRGHADWILKQVTASPKSLEGPKPTFVICEETQNWTPAEQGPKLASVIHHGLTKTNGRRIEVTNAPMPGEGTVAEKTHEFWKEVQDGDSEAEGLLFDTFSIHLEDIYDKEQAMPALAIMYEHAPWMNLKRVWRDINDKSAHSEADSRRFFFNEAIPPSAIWLKDVEWEAAEVPRLQLNKRDKIAVGVRVRKECAALVATRLKDSAIFVMKIWERPDSPNTSHKWEVPYGEIDKYMRKLVETHNVVYIMTSPNGFQDVVGRWAIEFEGKVTVEGYWLDKNKQKHADAVDLFECAVRDRRIKHTGDPDLKRHIMNCFITEAPQGSLLRMDKPYSRRFIMAAEAAVLSFQGAHQAIQDGLLEEEADNWVFSF